MILNLNVDIGSQIALVYWFFKWTPRTGCQIFRTQLNYASELSSVLDSPAQQVSSHAYTTPLAESVAVAYRGAEPLIAGPRMHESVPRRSPRGTPARAG